MKKIVLNWCPSLRNRSVDNEPVNQHIIQYYVSSNLKVMMLSQIIFDYVRYVQFLNNAYDKSMIE